MRFLNYTTKISVVATLGEVQGFLRSHGVARISILYGADGVADGLAFTLRTPHGDREFQLAVDVAGVHAALVQAEERGEFARLKQAKGTFSSPERAEQVAWRVVKDWLEAQLALIAAGMATLDQVMLPYLIASPEGETLYQVYRRRETAAISS